MKKRLTTTRKDEIFKKFWNQNDHFASLLNAVLFEGKHMIRPEELNDSDDGETSNVSTETPGEMNTVVKKIGHGAEFVLTGIEDPRDIPLQLLYQDSQQKSLSYQQWVYLQMYLVIQKMQST